MRDAEDFVCALQYQADAERVSQEWGPRLGKFGLERSADKTRVMLFTRQQAPGNTGFDCLGVELRGGQDRTGTPHLKRRTSRKKLRNSLKRLTDWCQEKCRSKQKDLCRELNAKWRGYYHDYGVNGNSASLREFFTCARRSLFQ